MYRVINVNHKYFSYIGKCINNSLPFSMPYFKLQFEDGYIEDFDPSDLQLL